MTNNLLEYLDRVRPNTNEIGTVISQSSGGYAVVVLSNGTRVTALLNKPTPEGSEVICFRPRGSKNWVAYTSPRRSSDERAWFTGGQSDEIVKPIGLHGRALRAGVLWSWHSWPTFDGAFEVQLSLVLDHSDAETIAVTTGCNWFTASDYGTLYTRVRSVSGVYVKSDWTEWQSCFNYGHPLERVYNQRLGETYPTLASAISAATSGDSLYIPESGCTEDVTIDRDLSIHGWIPGGVCFIEGTISISASSVTLSNLTLKADDQDVIEMLSTSPLLSIDNCLVMYSGSAGGNVIDTTVATEPELLIDRSVVISTNSLPSAINTSGSVMIRNSYVDIEEWNHISTESNDHSELVNTAATFETMTGGDLLINNSLLPNPISGWSTVTRNTNLHFPDLVDVDDYAGQGGKYIAVRPTEDGVEFIDGGSGGGSTGGTSIPTVDVPRWHIDGPLANADEVDGVWYVSENMELVTAIMYLRNTGTSSSTIIDIESSSDGGVTWSTLFAITANRPTISGGATDKRVSSAPDVTLIYAGDLLRLNIEQVAPGASGLSVQLQGVIHEMQTFTYNVELATANTEYSQSLPVGVRTFSIKVRGGADIRYAWETGKVAGGTGGAPVAPYNTLENRQTRFDQGIVGASETLYLASSTAGVVVEIDGWA